MSIPLKNQLEILKGPDKRTTHQLSSAGRLSLFELRYFLFVYYSFSIRDNAVLWSQSAVGRFLFFSSYTLSIDGSPMYPSRPFASRLIFLM